MRKVEIAIENLTPVWDELDMCAWVGKISGECYNSSKDTDKCVKRALNNIRAGHHSPWEHVNITLKCTVDRGVSHALVRHRHCAFTQSSTIYQRMDELTFITPTSMTDDLANKIEEQYKALLTIGNVPGEARDCLPNDLATTLVITTNMRQWMYMIQRRKGPGDSHKMHIWCAKVRDWFVKSYPIILGAFEEWYDRHPL